MGTPASSALLAVCRDQSDLAARLLGDDAAVRGDFVRAARHHRVAPLSHVRLRDADPELGVELREDRDLAIAVHLGATAVLEGLGHALGDVPWLAFKGPVLSEHAHPAPGLRTYHDVDVLVAPSDLREVTARLTGAGWTVGDYDHMLRLLDTPGEMHWFSPVGLQVDLHWSMINMAVRRRRFRVDTRDLLDRRRQVPVGLAHTWTLDPVDTLVHVCLHATLTGAHRMLLLLDVDQVARQIDDWSAVADRACEWRANAAMVVVLHRAARLLGTPLPDDLDELLGASPPFRAVTGLANRVSPVPSLRREASIARLVAKAARPGAGRTLAAIGRSGALGVRDRIRPRSSPARQPATPDAVEFFVRRVEAEAAE